MQLQLTEENFTKTKDEYRALVYGYWYGTKENKDSTPVDYDWAQYKLLDDAKVLHLYTARDFRDRLVGVALYVVISAMHHKGYVIADCDTLGTRLEHRGLGIGKQLVEFAKVELAKVGVKEILHHTRAIFGEQSLFQSLDFKPEEYTYSFKVT